MKHWVALIAAFCLLAASACSAQRSAPAETVRTQAETTQAQCETSAPETQTTSSAADSGTSLYTAPGPVSVTVLYTQKEESTDNGAVLLRQDLAEPSVVIAGSAEATAAINEVLSRRAAARQNDSAMFLEWAGENYAAAADTWTPYAMERSYTCGRLDGAVLSLACSDVDNTGGAHPNSAMSGISFRTDTGERLTISNMSTDEEKLRATVTEEIKRQVRALGDALYDNAEAAAETLLDDDDWYFSPEGLEVLCNEYIMAPHAAGVLRFTVPYAKLTGVLRQELLPRERAAQTGSLRVAPGSGEKTPDYVLVLDADGADAALTADGPVSDLRISRAVWDENGTACSAGELYYACDSLADGDGVVVRSMIPDTMPAVLVSYTGADGEHSYGLSQSGKDGSFLLLDVDTH